MNCLQVSVSGGTALLVATMMENIEAADALLDAGADPNPVDSKMRTPLHHAAQQGCADLVTVLMQRGADPAATCPQLNGDPLTPYLMSSDRATRVAFHKSHYYTPWQWWWRERCTALCGPDPLGTACFSCCYTSYHPEPDKVYQIEPDPEEQAKQEAKRAAAAMKADEERRKREEEEERKQEERQERKRKEEEEREAREAAQRIQDEIERKENEVSMAVTGLHLLPYMDV
jgi:hypothetical protein